MILFFLIPVNMLFGRLPSQAMLDRFDFTMVPVTAVGDA